ncbi:hypothetical protein SARC_16736, partial [Sphaeroforma arctica JP610]
MMCSLAILLTVSNYVAPLLNSVGTQTATDDYTTSKVFAIDAQMKIIMQQSGDPASSTVIVKGRAKASQPRMAIAYLTRNTKSDALYQRDSNTLLAKSLDLVFENVMPYTAADVIIFHEGDFSSEDQKKVIKGRPHIKFHTLSAAEWGPPAFIDEKELPSWHEGSKYGMGYRNMIRFYANRIWPLVSVMGYEYVMRLDEESFIHSPIKYDLAERMTSERLVYGYRQDQTEYPTYGAWHYDIEPTFLYDHCTPRNIAGLKTGLHDLHSYYNNFFIARVDFFTSTQVQQFLNYADRTGGYYYSRWGDAIVHTAAVQIFLHTAEVHKFTDFSYEHATLNKTDNTLTWGGLAVGSED